MNRILPGDPRNAGPLDANFQEIVAILAALTDANIAANAGISGSKLALNSIPGDRLVNGTIPLAKMGAGSVDTAQLVNLAVTKGKLTTTVGSRITKAQTEIKALTGNAGFSIGGTQIGFSFMAEAAQQVVLGTNSWIIKVTQKHYTNVAAMQSPPNTTVVLIVPGAAVPVASTTPLGIVMRNAAFNLGGGSVDCDLMYIDNA